MNAEALEIAKREAERFLDRVRDLEAAATDGSLYWHPKQTGAVRRASMDLTRALAEMRRYS